MCFFHADLSCWVEGRSLNLCYIQHPEARGVLLSPIDGGDRWCFQAFFYPAAGQRAEDFTPQHCAELICTAVEVPGLPVEVLRAAPWNSAARVAERFHEGKTFLAGRTGTAWCQAAAEVTHARRVPLQAFTVGPAGDLVEPDETWAPTYGVEQDGAVLVRPDGHVAWRCRGSVTHPGQVLQGVLVSVLGETAAREMGNLAHTFDRLSSYTSKGESW